MQFRNVLAQCDINLKCLHDSFNKCTVCYLLRNGLYAWHSKMIILYWLLIKHCLSHWSFRCKGYKAKNETVKLYCYRNEKFIPPRVTTKSLMAHHLDNVLRCVEILCKTEDSESGKSAFSTPSIGLKLGHTLNKCTQLKNVYEWEMAKTLSKRR